MVNSRGHRASPELKQWLVAATAWDLEDAEEDDHDNKNTNGGRSQASAAKGGWRSENVPYRGVSEDIASRMEIDV